MMMISALRNSNYFNIVWLKHEAVIEHPFVLLNNSEKYYRVLVNNNEARGSVVG
jgi:hypothetical protein